MYHVLVYICIVKKDKSVSWYLFSSCWFSFGHLITKTVDKKFQIEWIEFEYAHAQSHDDVCLSEGM